METIFTKMSTICMGYRKPMKHIKHKKNSINHYLLLSAGQHSPEVDTTLNIGKAIMKPPSHSCIFLLDLLCNTIFLESLWLVLMFAVSWMIQRLNYVPDGFNWVVCIHSSETTTMIEQKIKNSIH